VSPAYYRDALWIGVGWVRGAVRTATPPCDSLGPAGRRLHRSLGASFGHDFDAIFPLRLDSWRDGGAAACFTQVLVAAVASFVAAPGTAGLGYAYCFSCLARSLSRGGRKLGEAPPTLRKGFLTQLIVLSILAFGGALRYAL